MKEKVQALSNFMLSDTVKYFDWALSFIMLGYGLYLLQSTGINFTSITALLVGVIGVFLAKIRPAVLLKGYLDKKFIRRG